MIKLGINEFIRNVKKNIMVIIQLTIVFVLSIMIVSIYESQTRMSSAVMKYIDDTGAYVLPDETKWDEAKVLALPGVKKLIYAKKLNMYVYSKGFENAPDGTITFAVYDENLINYRPKLKSGKWYSDVADKEGKINVVISENAMGYSIGDTIFADTYDINDKHQKIEFYVTGVVYDRTMLFGQNNEYKNSNNSYLSLFSNSYEKDSDGIPCILAVMSKENLEKYNFLTGYSNTIVDYDNNISEKQLEADNKSLKEMAIVSDTAKMRQNSNSILYNKLGGITVLFIVLVIITIASIICSGAVTYLYEKRNYGIYFMTGNTWGKTIVLSLVNWILIISSSLIITIGVLAIGTKRNWFDNYSLSYSAKTFVLQCIIVIVTLVTALIIPIIKMRKTQPVEIIKNND